MSRPSKWMRPSDEIMRASARPSVVLPEPDSPTTPSVWPARTVTSMPSTAFTWSTTVRKKPCLIGNQTFMSVAGHHRPGGGVGRRRLALRLGGEQMAGVVMLRVGEDFLGRPGLDDLALGHHADAVGDLADDAEVVGDEEHRHALLGLQLGEQFEDLRLHGDVERGGRLVGDQQFRLVGERHGDHHALALAAGELVRIGAEPLFGLADADLLEQFQRPCARPASRACPDAATGPRRSAARSCAAD